MSFDVMFWLETFHGQSLPAPLPTDLQDLRESRLEIGQIFLLSLVGIWKGYTISGSPKYFHLSSSNRMLVPLHLNKPALRTLGIAESFVRTCSISRLAGVVMRADLRVDGVAFARATVGGDDATEGVLKIYEQLGRADINAMILSGAVISWFNIIDIQEVFDIIQKPVICLTYEESPGLERYIREYFQNPEEKLRRYQRLGRREIITLKTGYQVYIRVLGATAEEARVLINKFTLDGRVPEPVRVARLAARAAMHSDEGFSG